MARHRYDAALRWSDIDALGHVNNVAYLSLLQEARVGLYAARLGTIDWQETGAVVARHEIEYATPLTFRAEPVPIDVWVTRVGTTSYTLAYEIRDDDAVYARASTVMVKWDLLAGRPKPLDDEERRVLESLRDEATPA